METQFKFGEYLSYPRFGRCIPYGETRDGETIAELKGFCGLELRHERAFITANEYPVMLTPDEASFVYDLLFEGNVEADPVLNNEWLALNANLKYTYTIGTVRGILSPFMMKPRMHGAFSLWALAHIHHGWQTTDGQESDRPIFMTKPILRLGPCQFNSMVNMVITI